METRDSVDVLYRLEESHSAFKPGNRPEFDKMIALIESKQANAILTWKPDRLCRNPKEGGHLLQLLQDNILKEIRCATGEVYTPESDHLILQIHFGMANQYSRNLSQNVKRGLSHKCERGQYPRPAPVGFEGYGERGQRNIKLHPFEAPILKSLFEMASTGKFSLAYLVDIAYKQGLRTKTGKRISKSHLHVILTSPTYYGYFYQNGELYKGNFEPLIPKTLWDMVQKALMDRSKPAVNSWKSEWNGLAYCGVCGCAITISNKTKNYKRTGRSVIYSYAHCTHRRGNCTQPPIPLKDFQQMILDEVSKVVIDQKTWELGIKLLKERHKDETSRNLNQLSGYEAEEHLLQDKLNKLVDMRADGELTRDEFMKQKEAILKEMASVEALIADTKLSARNWLERTEEFLDNAFHAREIMFAGQPEEKKKLLMSIGEDFILKDKKLQFSFKKPYDVLLIPKYRTNMLRD